MNTTENGLLDRPSFPTVDVAERLNIPFSTISNWLTRRDIRALERDPHELRSPGTGRSRRFSLRRVLHIALMAQLVRVGLAPRAASYAALRWTDDSDSPARYAADAHDPTKDRNPGELFKDGKTLFIVWHGLDGTEDNPDAAVVRYTDTSELDDLFSPNKSRQADAITVIDLGELDYRTRAALGVL